MSSESKPDLGHHHSGRWSQAITLGLGLAYCAAVFVHPPNWWPQSIRQHLIHPKTAILRWLRQALADGTSAPRIETVESIYLTLLGVVIPWIVMTALGRGRPVDLGCRAPNRYGWRIVVIGFLFSLPFLAWMVGGSEIGNLYLRQYRRAGLAAFLGYYLVNMCAEHFFFHGVLLAAFRRDRRWPGATALTPVTGTGWRRWMQWVGLAQPIDHHAVGRLERVRQWLGLPRGCAVAMVGSAALFGFIHVGKDVRELLLSFPGGLASAYLAYRSNSWLTPLALHLATAGTAFLMLLARQ